MIRALLLLLFSAGVLAQTKPQPPAEAGAEQIEQILSSARRIPTSSRWFEVLHLPVGVYAFWEPGHVEKVNSFLVIGRDRDMLYDTGMGIGSIRRAIEEVREAEGLPVKPLLVVNSHNHLDHNGGNREFAEVWTVDHPWVRQRLSTGVAAGEAGGFVGYWDQLTPHPGIEVPEHFSPLTHAIPPYPLSQVRYVAEGDVIDLGDQRFEVIRTFSHSPDGLALFDVRSGRFFGGDTFYGADYLVTDTALLAKDLARIRDLPIRWHFASHGGQLVAAMQQGKHLAVVQRMLAGEGETHTTQFAGFELPVRALEGVTVTVAKELLLY
jgi:glyoxylase-like metal-dependent hydrolase (beta-lactamase superfamily II)